MRILLALLAALAVELAFPQGAFAAGDHAVRGHVTKRGAYVAPTRATNPNTTQRDNYGAKPNVNPATGKAGKRTPTN